MHIRDLDLDEGLFLLKYRMLPPGEQQELIRLLDELHEKEARSSQNDDDEH